jgi:TonB family protein
MSDVQPVPTTSAENLDSLVSSLAVFTADQVQVPAVLDTTRHVSIAYPPALYAAHTGGIVVAEFVVDAKGRVEENTFSIVSTSHALFADAVHNAIASAVFIPAVMDGRPVRQLVHQPFTFEGPK